MPVKVLIFTVFVAVAVGVKRHGKHSLMAQGQTHEFGIKYLSSTGPKRWTVNNVEVGKAIIDYMSRRINKPVISAVSGYRGYSINHIIDGRSIHTWLLAKCERPGLELAILEHPTKETARDVPPRLPFKDTLNKCPSKTKQK